MRDPMTRVIEPFLANADAALPGRYSAVLYGSVARGDHVPDRSDVNLMLLVDEAPPAMLQSLGNGFRAWRKAGQEPPLLMTRREWSRAADAFPVEITDMQLAYKVLRGSDPLKEIQVDRADLRRALEREFRGKLVRLRQSYAALASEPAALGGVAAATAGSVLVLFRALFVLLRRTIPADATELARAAAAVVGANGETLAQVVRYRRQRDGRCSAAEFEGYLEAVHQTTDFLDQLQLGDA